MVHSGGQVDMLEAESEATQEMVSGGTSDFENQFKALEGGDIDDELAQMKKAISGDVDNKVKQIDSSTKKITTDIDDELEELRRKAKEL